MDVGGSWILEAVPRDRDDDAGAAQLVGAAQEGESGGRRGLAEQALDTRQLEPGRDDLLVRDRVHERTALRDEGAVGRLLDPDRACQRSCPVGRLDRVHRRCEPQLGQRLRVGRRVAAAAVGEDERVRRASELLDDLEHGCLLPLDPVRVERVDEHVVAPVGEPAGGRERLVEAAAHRQHAGPERARLDELAGRRALGDEDERGQPGAGGVRSGRRSGVPGRRADHGARTVLECLRHGDRHPRSL